MFDYFLFFLFLIESIELYLILIFNLKKKKEGLMRIEMDHSKLKLGAIEVKNEKGDEE